MYATIVNRLLLPAMLAFSRSRYLRIARQSADRQFWTTAKMVAWQTKRVSEMVRFATQNTEFYRDHYASTGVNSQRLKTLNDLLDLPVVTKADVEANFPDRMASGEADKDELRWEGSGGTTHRIMVISDFSKRDHVRAASALTYTADTSYRLGDRATHIPPDACSSLCGVEGMRSATVLQHLFAMAIGGKLRDSEARSDLRGLVMNNWIERKKILDPFGPDGTHISDARLAEYMLQLRQSKPILLKALPEYLRALARHSAQTGDRISSQTRVIKPMGAVMPPTVKRDVEDAFGIAVREDYGSGDLGPMGFDCGQRSGMHLMLDHYHFEFMHNGRPAEDGELAVLLVTDLHNRAMPLIRYKIGDIVRVDRSTCQCGRHTPRLVVEGRLEDTIVNDEQVTTARMTSEFFYGEPGIDDFQLIERPRRFDLQFVPRDSGPHPEALTQRFADFLKDSRPLRLREVATILPENSGKFRHVKSCSHERLQWWTDSHLSGQATDRVER